VQNPETLKGQEGKHVSVQAHVYSDKNAIHIMSVEPSKDSGEMKKEK
jgi:hypothetical protein